MDIANCEIGENTKMAREMTLLGNYESAEIYYQAVMQMIQRQVHLVDDTSRKAKWNVVSNTFIFFY